MISNTPELLRVRSRCPSCPTDVSRHDKTCPTCNYRFMRQDGLEPLPPSRRREWPHRDEFEEELFRLNMDSGMTRAKRQPTVGGRDLDFYRFYHLVTDLGGYELVVENRQMKLVAERLGVQRSVTNAPHMLRQNYVKYLANFERVYFFGLEAQRMDPMGGMLPENTDPIAGPYSNMPPAPVLPVSTASLTPSGSKTLHPVANEPDVLRMSGTHGAHEFQILQRVCRSLETGNLIQITWALNTLGLLLGYPGRSILQLSYHPELLPAVITLTTSFTAERFGPDAAPAQSPVDRIVGLASDAAVARAEQHAIVTRVAVIVRNLASLRENAPIIVASTETLTFLLASFLLGPTAEPELHRHALMTLVSLAPFLHISHSPVWAHVVASLADLACNEARPDYERAALRIINGLTEQRDNAEVLVGLPEPFFEKVVETLDFVQHEELIHICVSILTPLSRWAPQRIAAQRLILQRLLNVAAYHPGLEPRVVAIIKLLAIEPDFVALLRIHESNAFLHLRHSVSIADVVDILAESR